MVQWLATADTKSQAKHSAAFTRARVNECHPILCRPPRQPKGDVGLWHEPSAEGLNPHTQLLKRFRI